MASPTEDRPPAYVPWKTFESYVKRWKDSTPPHRIDNAVMPTGMDNGTRGQLKSGLKFLGLTTDDGTVVADKFGQLVEAVGTPEWPKAVKECILPAYKAIIGDLPIENSTPMQLDECFKSRGKLDGQMLEKAVRFYVQAVKEAGVKHSKHWDTRREKAKRKRPTATTSGKQDTNKAKGNKGQQDREEELKVPSGLMKYPLYFQGKTEGMIYVPKDLDKKDMPVIERTVGVIRAYVGIEDEKK